VANTYKKTDFWRDGLGEYGGNTFREIQKDGFCLFEGKIVPLWERRKEMAKKKRIAELQKLQRDTERIVRRANGEGARNILKADGMTCHDTSDGIPEALARWEKANVGAMEELIGREMMKLENLESVLMRDYENSRSRLKPMEYAALMARGLSMDEIDECFKDRERGGDPKYLNTMMNLTTAKLRLMGIVGRADNRKQTVVQYNFGDLGEDEIKNIVDKLQDGKYESGD
jgi:hypothetical protein